MGFLRFFGKGTKTCFLSTNPKKRIKKTGGLRFFLIKRVFLNPDYLSILFCDFPLIARSGTSHVTINSIGRSPYT